MSLRCWFGGESEEIKANLIAIQKSYNAVLLESYKLLDPENMLAAH